MGDDRHSIYTNIPLNSKYFILDNQIIDMIVFSPNLIT